MKQIHFFKGTPQGSSGWFVNPFENQSSFQEFPEAQGTVTMPTGGVIRNFRMRLTVAPGSTHSITLTWKHNGSGTSLAVTVTGAATEGTDSSNSITVAAGDAICVAMTRSGTPAATDAICSFEFEPTSDNESVYGFGGQNTQNASLRYTGLLYANNVSTGWPSTTVGTIFSSLVAIPGDVTGYRMRLAAAPGAGKSWTFAIYKNSIKQDGTNGTPNTVVTVADAATGGTGSFAMSVVAGDIVEVEASPSGVPTATRLNGMCLFASSFPGLFQVGSSHNAVPVASATRFFWPQGSWALAGSTTETDRELISNPTTMQLNSIRARATDASSDLDSQITFTLRKNQTDTALAVALSGPTPAVGFTNASVDIADGDEWALAVTAAGAVGGSTAFQVVFSAGVVILSENNLLTGSQHTAQGDNNLISGADGTVVGDRVVLLALAQTSPPPSFTGDGTFIVFGDIIFPTLPTANPSVAGQLWNDSGTLKVSAG